MVVECGIDASVPVGCENASVVEYVSVGVQDSWTVAVDSWTIAVVTWSSFSGCHRHRLHPSWSSMEIWNGTVYENDPWNGTGVCGDHET